MKTLAVVVAVVALSCAAFATQQDKERSGKKEGQEQQIQVMKPSQAEWKQADKMPQGVMKSLVCESKGGGAIYLMKFPAGTKVPAHMAQGQKVIHVHHGQLEVGQGPAVAGQDKGEKKGGLEGQGAQGQSATDGDIIKIAANTSYWLHAKSETLAIVAMEKTEASGRAEDDSEKPAK